MADLLAAEAESRLPGFVFFWSAEPSSARPGPWVLAQRWEAPITVDGMTYATAEHYMMAEKARCFGDDDALAAVLAATDRAVVKRIGRRVTPFDPEVWAARAYDIVVRGNVAKFSAHDDLRAYLLSTAPRALVEASPVDAIWGIGLAAGDAAAQRPSEWRGANLLGFALMDVRERLA